MISRLERLWHDCNLARNTGSLLASTPATADEAMRFSQLSSDYLRLVAVEYMLCSDGVTNRYSHVQRRRRRCGRGGDCVGDRRVCRRAATTTSSAATAISLSNHLDLLLYHIAFQGVGVSPFLAVFEAFLPIVLHYLHSQPLPTRHWH